MEFSFVTSLLLLCTFQISSASPFYEGMKHRSYVFPHSEQNKWPFEGVEGHYSIPMHFEEFPHNSNLEEPAYTLQNEQPLYYHTNFYPDYYYTPRTDIGVPNHNLNKRAENGDLGLNSYKNPEEEDNQTGSSSGYGKSNIKENEESFPSGSSNSGDDACQSCQQKAYNQEYGKDKNMLLWCALLECQRRERLMRLKDLIDSQRQVIKGKLNELIKDNSKIKVTDGMNDFPQHYDYNEYYGEEDDPYPNYYLYDDIQSFSGDEAGYSKIPSDESADESSSPAVLYTIGDEIPYVNPSPSDTMTTTLEEDYKYYDGLKENYFTGKSNIPPKGVNALTNDNPFQPKSSTDSSEEDYNFYDDPEYVNLTEKSQLSPTSESLASNNSAKPIIVSPNEVTEDSNFYDDLEYTNMNVKQRNSSILHNNSSKYPSRKFNSISTEKNFGRGKNLPELFKGVTKYPSKPYGSRIYPARMTTSKSEKAIDSYPSGSPYQPSENMVDNNQLGLALQTTNLPIPYLTNKMKNNEGKTSDPKDYITFDEDRLLQTTTFLPLLSHDIKAHEPSSNFRNADDKEGLRIGTKSTKYGLSKPIKLSTTPLPPILGATVNKRLEKVAPVKSDESRKSSERFKGTTEANKKRTASNNQYFSKEIVSVRPTTSSDGKINRYELTSFNYDDNLKPGEILATYDRKMIPENENMPDNSYIEAANRNVSDIPHDSVEGDFPSTVSKEKTSEPSLPLVNDLIHTLENFAKKDIMPVKENFYDQVDKNGKVVKYCLCQCPTEVSPTNINFFESDGDDEHKAMNDLETYLSHDELFNSFISDTPSTMSPLDSDSQLFAFKEKIDSHTFKESDTSNSPIVYPFSSFDPNSNHFLELDDGKGFPSNNDRNKESDINEDLLNNFRETKSPLIFKSYKMPYSTSKTISSTTSETDHSDYMDGENGYDHLIPMNFEGFSEYMDKPYSSRVNYKADHDDVKNRKVMPGLISKSDGIVELEYDCRDQMFPHSHLGIDSGRSFKGIDPEKEYQSPRSEQKPSLMRESDKVLPSLFHSSRGNAEMETPAISTSDGSKDVLHGKAADHRNREKHILGDRQTNKEQNRKLSQAGNLHASTSNLNQNKAPSIEDRVVSQSEFMSDGEDYNDKNQRKQHHHSEFREADPNSLENTDDNFPHVYHSNQFHQITTPKNELPDELHMTDNIVPFSLESIAPVSSDANQQSEKGNLAPNCPSCNWNNRKVNESKLNPMIDSLQKIKKNYMNEGDGSLPSASQDKSKSCDVACKQHVKDKLKALISIISWLEESFK